MFAAAAHVEPDTTMNAAGSWGDLSDTVYLDPRTGVRRLRGSIVQSAFPVYGYLSKLPAEGFPYEYYFENGVTHLVFQGISFDHKTYYLTGTIPRGEFPNAMKGETATPSSGTNATNETEVAHLKPVKDLPRVILPSPGEWARVREIARHYQAKLILGIGGLDWLTRPGADQEDGSSQKKKKRTFIESGAFDTSDVWGLDGYCHPDDLIQKGLDNTLHLYFYFAKADEEFRRRRRLEVKHLAKLIVDWDFDGVDVDYRGRRGIGKSTLFVAVKNLLRDIREEVEKLRLERSQRSASTFWYPHFLTSATLPATEKAMAAIGISENFNDAVDVVHWRLQNAPLNDNFFFEKGFEMLEKSPLTSAVELRNDTLDSTEEAEEDRTTLPDEEAVKEGEAPQRRAIPEEDGAGWVVGRELGHGPQHGSFYYHSNLNYTVYHALHIAESRYASEVEHRDMGEWYKYARVTWEDERVLEDAPRYLYRPDVVERRKTDMIHGRMSLCTPAGPVQEAMDASGTADGTPNSANQHAREDHPRLIHSLMLPFFGMDTLRGFQSYHEIIDDIQRNPSWRHELGLPEEKVTEVDTAAASSLHAGVSSKDKEDDDEGGRFASSESEKAFAEAVKHVYVVEGMGFDTTMTLPRKLRLAAQLGFGAVALFALDLDISPYPSSFVSGNTTARNKISVFATSPAMTSFPVIDTLDLSTGKSYKDLVSTTVVPTLPPPPLSLLRAIHEEIQLWELEMRQASSSPLEGRWNTELSPTMCDTPSLEVLEPFLFTPNNFVPRLHRPLSRRKKTGTKKVEKTTNKEADAAVKKSPKKGKPKDTPPPPASSPSHSSFTEHEAPASTTDEVEGESTDL